jgi:hypothetical protein
MVASALNSRRGHDVDRQHDLPAARASRSAQVSTISASSSGRPRLVPLRLEEREAHTAADEQPVHLGQQRLDHGELVGDLGAAEHHHVGPVRVLGEPPQHVQLPHHQPPP